MLPASAPPRNRSCRRTANRTHPSQTFSLRACAQKRPAGEDGAQGFHVLAGLSVPQLGDERLASPKTTLHWRRSARTVARTTVLRSAAARPHCWPVVGIIAVPGQELIDPVSGILGDAGQDVIEPGLRVDVVHLRRDDQAAQGGGAPTTTIRNRRRAMSGRRGQCRAAMTVRTPTRRGACAVLPAKPRPQHPPVQQA